MCSRPSPDHPHPRIQRPQRRKNVLKVNSYLMHVHRGGLHLFSLMKEKFFFSNGTRYMWSKLWKLGKSASSARMRGQACEMLMNSRQEGCSWPRHGSSSTGVKYYHQDTGLSRDLTAWEGQSTRELIPDNTRQSPKKYLKSLIYCITLERKMVSIKKEKNYPMELLANLGSWNFRAIPYPVEIRADVWHL